MVIRMLHSNNGNPRVHVDCSEFEAPAGTGTAKPLDLAPLLTMPAFAPPAYEALFQQRGAKSETAGSQQSWRVRYLPAAGRSQHWGKIPLIRLADGEPGSLLPGRTGIKACLDVECREKLRPES